MQPITLLKPLLHGAVGFWDEVINLIPLVIGAALLLYMYHSSRKRKSETKKEQKRKE